MDLKITSDQLNMLINRVIKGYYKGYEWKVRPIQGSRISLLQQSGNGFLFFNSEKNNTVLSFYRLTLGDGPFAITKNTLFITNDFVNVLNRYFPKNRPDITDYIVKWVENELNVKVDSVSKTPVKLV